MFFSFYILFFKLQNYNFIIVFSVEDLKWFYAGHDMKIGEPREY